MICSPSKILLYMPSLDGGGAERSMINLARGFIAQGMEVDLVVSSADGDYHDEVPPEVRLVSLGVRRVAAVIPLLARYIRQHSPDVMMSRMYRSNLVALMAARLAGDAAPPVFVIMDNTTTKEMAEATSGWKTRVRNQIDVNLIRSLYPSAAGIIAVSAGVANDIASLARIDRNNIAVIYNPLEFDEIRRLSNARVEHPWFDDETPLLLAAGRLNRQKDYPTLIRAIARLPRERKVRLMILGKGDEQHNVEALIQTHELCDQVEVVGFIPNPFPYMKRANLFVLSSAWEGLGNVLIEAMALGTPVVSTDCPHGPREILAGGEFGPLAPVGDDKALASAILTVLDSPVESEKLISRARAYDAPHIVEEYLEFFSKSLRKDGKQPDR